MFTHFRIFLMLVLWSVLLVPIPAHAQNENAVVYGVFFYSPNCSHCHEVLVNHWPQIKAKFGDQLQVVFVDVSTQSGSSIMQTATDAMHIDSNSVPMLIIGETVLIGSRDIPEQTPSLIQNGLQNGGIAIPIFPGSANLFEQAGIRVVDATSPVTTHEVVGITASTPDIETNKSILDKLNSDPLANTGAIIVLLGLLLSLFVVSRETWQIRDKTTQPMVSPQTEHRIIIGLALLAALLAITLLVGKNNDGMVTIIAFAELVVFAIIAAVVGKSNDVQVLPDWLFPIVILAGLGVAGYLTYIETSTTEAVCGTVGHCNTVQESKYASILGVPIGVVGVIGYLSIFALWVWHRIQPNEIADAGLLGLATVGVLFSAYLTFLEPFVIGATCIWCLTSAITMLIILWMVAPRGYQALHQLVQKKA